MQFGEEMLDCNVPGTYSSQASGVEFSKIGYPIYSLSLEQEHETRLRAIGLLRAWWYARNKAHSGEKMSAITTRKRSIGTSTLAPVKNEPALTCLNSVRRAR
jgi:hypothetical protein